MEKFTDKHKSCKLSQSVLVCDQTVGSQETLRPAFSSVIYYFPTVVFDIPCESLFDIFVPVGKTNILIILTFQSKKIGI